MAYYDNLDDEQNQQQKSATGSVIAGSGGAASQGPTTTGTGFTNLQKYLEANKGSGEGLADNIISQGQNAVSEAQKKADDDATAWADQGVQKANYGAQNAVDTYNRGAAELKADPWNTEGMAATATRGVSYSGPKSVDEINGRNQLEQNYHDVKNAATKHAGDLSTQQAAMQKQYGYGSGFAALDTFLGKQDGRDKIEGWAANVNPGSAQPHIDRVSNAITGAQQRVTDAQTAFGQTAADAHRQRVKPETLRNVEPIMERGIASAAAPAAPLKPTTRPATPTTTPNTSNQKRLDPYLRKSKDKFYDL